MLSCKSLSEAHRKRLRARACGVAIALVGLLFIGMEPLNEGSHDLTPKAYIRQLLPSKEALCLIRLYGKESAWNVYAIGNVNGKIQSYGIPQLKNPLIAHLSAIEQVNYGIKYINHRYSGDACKAWKHWQEKGWH
jgi:hypothetical protein